LLKTQKGDKKMSEQEAIEKIVNFQQIDFITRKGRDERYHKLKAQGGYKLRRWVLRDQEVGYNGFGSMRDLTRRNIYMLDVAEVSKE